MRKSVLMISAAMMLMACGGQTKQATSDADSTQVFEVPDTLNTVEAVVKQVDAVYAYWNEMREHYDEIKPSVDERFGTKEWLQVREDAWAADRDCECGGFFDFGDEGPLDPWVYDCYEGTVSANDIEAKILSDGTADVKFLVKDAVTPKGIPMRWQMRVEDGEWRVANIIFEKDGGIDLLASLRDYGREFKEKQAKEGEAQDAIRVNYKGEKPSLSDFITAYLAPTTGEDGECDTEYMNGIRRAWDRYRKGLKQDEGDTFTLDEKNGFAVYEYKYSEGACEFMTRIEMCLWNEADGMHKLFAYNHGFYRDGKYYPGQYDGLTFMRYNNATKSMTYHSDKGVEAVYEAKAPSIDCSFALPRSGKDIIVSLWDENGKKTEKTLKWNGHGFSY